MNLSLDVAVSATGGVVIERERAPEHVRVNTDTRTIAPGETFLALHGERFDGHDFVPEALQRGAAMVVIDRPTVRVAGNAAMLVKDTKSAYMALAHAARMQFEHHVIAITGSTGKTTTKSFLTQLLSVKYGDRVLSAPANENNEIGVSKLLLRASNDAHDVVVVEMGARHFGDIAALVEIARPQIGILTNIGEAHLEIMGSRERLEETKWALFGAGARAVLNAADPVSRRRAATLDRVPHWFATQPIAFDSSVESSMTLLLDDRVLHRTNGTQTEYPVAVRLPGVHNRANAAAAIAGALALNVGLERMLPQISTLQLPQGRYDRIAVQSGLRLIYDAYNANASGMMAALDAFSCEAGSRRIAMLASMAELGNESKHLHERVGAHAAARVDTLLVSGEYASDLARGATRGGLETSQIVLVENNAQAVRWLRENARPQDVVLLKGSRKYKLEEIVEALRT